MRIMAFSAPYKKGRRTGVSDGASSLIVGRTERRQKQELNATARIPEFVSGESFYYLGKCFRLRVVDEAKSPLHTDGEWFLLRRPDRAKAVEHFRSWYLDTGAPWLSKRVVAWQPRVNAEPSRISVGDLGFRWGSCGKRGAVHFNWR